jgi:hypothetical protein
MNATNTQLISLYDNDDQMTVEALASAFDLEVESVKLALSAGSRRYMKEVESEPSLFTNDDERIAAETIKKLCYSEIDGVALKAATILIDEKRGRRDPRKNAKKIGVLNVNILNQYLTKGKEQMAKLDEAINI